MTTGLRPKAIDAFGQETERWDDAFEFDAHQSLDQIFELFHRHCPQSPLSDSSDQSDYFQARSPPPPPPTLPSTLPLPIPGSLPPLPHPFSATSSLPPTLLSPPATTTTTHALWSLHKKEHQKTKHLHGFTSSYEKADPRSCSSCLSTPTKHATNNSNNSNNDNNNTEFTPKANSLSSSTSFRIRHDGQSLYYAATTPADETTKMPSFSPTSSASSSPRAITASVTAPSTIATSTGSLLGKYKSADSGGDKDNPSSLSTKSMTTITQEMMLSNLPAYTGIITRINPIKRVKAWVDDLEDLEVPEEDLNFNHVRSILAKSTSLPETLESIDSWDTGSERSVTTSDRVDTAAVEGQPKSPLPRLGTPHVLRDELTAVFSVDDQKAEAALGGEDVGLEKIETLDDAFDIPDDFGSFRLRMSPRLQNHSGPQETARYRQQLSLLQWRDSGSDFDELDFITPLDSHSLSSSVSISRESVVEDDDNLLDGIEFPEAMEDLRLVTHRQYKVEMEPSIFEKESRLQEDQDDFWDGLEIGDDDAFNHKGRNKNLVSKSSLPRLKRNSISRKEGARIGSTLPMPGPAVSSGEGIQASSPSSIRPIPSSTTALSTPSMRNSALINRDDLTSYKSNSLAMRSVSFTEPSQPVDHSTSTPVATPTTPAPAIIASLPPVPPTNTGRPFSSLRTLVRKLDLARPRFSIRGQIPAFDTSSPVPEESPALSDSKMLELKPIEESSPTDDPEEGHYQARPSLSRSSSLTDWGSVNASTETTKESKSPSRIGTLFLDEISEGGSTTSDLGEIATASPVAAEEKFSRRWFLKRSPKQSMLSDGSELDRIDNLPTFGPSDQQCQQLQQQHQQALERGQLQAMQMAAAVAAAQGRRQSLDRVSAWLRKPQSMVNLKESPRPEVKRAESDVSTKVQKTKSIRRSLFDIFGQSSAPVEEKKVEPVPEKAPSAKEQKLKKKKRFSGPTLIRDLSQTKVRKVSGMVFHPESKMWNGNDHILNDFDDDDDIDNNTNGGQQQQTPTVAATAVFDYPASPSSCQQHFSNSSFSPIANAIIRPALISNMSQYSKQRTQVAGKMIFDPNRMCWIINPEYLSRRRQKKHGDQHLLHHRQTSLDDTWGDEPDVFAGMSDSDSDQDEDENDKEVEEVRVGAAPTTATAAVAAMVSESANSSLERSRGRRLISRPSFRRMSSQDYLADEERLQAWAENMRPPTPGGGPDTRPNSMGVHSIVSKSSRRSLNMTGGCSNGLFVGGGYSSRGEFEVGIEFDITDDFLEECMATESQHRKDAGKFFALPCTPVKSKPTTTTMPHTRTLKRMPSKVLNKLMKSSSNGDHGVKEKGKKDKEKVKDGRKLGRDTTPADALPPAPTKGEKEVVLSPSAPLPLLSWPRRTKSKSVVLQSPILDCIGLPPLPETQRTNTLKPLTLQIKADEKPRASIPSIPSKFKSLTLGRSGSSSPTPTPAPAPLSPQLLSNMPIRGKDKGVSPMTVSVAAAETPRVRKSSRDLFFSQRLSSKKPHTPADRGTLTFAATFAIARKGNSAYDRRRISAQTFHPMTSAGPTLGGSGSNSDETTFRKDNRVFALDGDDSGIESDEAAEDEDDCERGYRKMPNSRDRAPRRTRSQLIMEFAQHSGPGYRF
ncbi:hypothetical protein BGX23_003874 [Mortierella sp. AD031]|nr:hypothetical protein BGX23_003874 [Mortierella sp. AD031]